MNQDLRRKLDRITDILWAGGVTNPVTYIEQISYLIYLKLLDEEEADRELRTRLTGNKGNGNGSSFSQSNPSAIAGQNGVSRVELTFVIFSAMKSFRIWLRW